MVLLYLCIVQAPVYICILGILCIALTEKGMSTMRGTLSPLIQSVHRPGPTAAPATASPTYPSEDEICAHHVPLSTLYSEIFASKIFQLLNYRVKNILAVKFSCQKYLGC